MRVPWTARRSNQSILKKINPEYSLEGLILKLKLQYFGHLMGRAMSLEKTLILGKIEGRTERGQEDEMVGWHHQLNKHDLGQTLGDGEGQRSLVWCSPWGYRVRHNFQQHDLIGLSRVANIVFHSHVYLHLQMMFLRQYLSSVEESGMIN